MKKIVLLVLFSFSLFAKDSNTEQNKSFGEKLNDFADSFSKDLNVSEKLKFDNLVRNIKELELNDDFDKKKFENFRMLIPYKRNYIMVFGYDTHEHKDDRKNSEAKFQLSTKFPLFQNFLSSGGDLYAAYTQNSQWQVYNGATSRPFRETNYQPELFMDFNLHDKYTDGFDIRNILVGIIHQSNGQDRPKSRSWNRANLEVIFGYGKFTFGGNIWNRFDEDSYDSDNKDTDDNPDLEKFIGKQNIFVRYDYKQDNQNYSFLIMHQNDFFNYNSGIGSTKIEYTFPSRINKNFDFIFQFFNGYGESLIDYNERVNKVYFGVLFTDWSFKLF